MWEDPAWMCNELESLIADWSLCFANVGTIIISAAPDTCYSLFDSYTN